MRKRRKGGSEIFKEKFLNSLNAPKDFSYQGNYLLSLSQTSTGALFVKAPDSKLWIRSREFESYLQHGVFKVENNLM